MAEKYNSKVVLASGEVLMDLTGDDITAADLAKGKRRCSKCSLGREQCHHHLRLL